MKNNSHKALPMAQRMTAAVLGAALLSSTLPVSLLPAQAADAAWYDTPISTLVSWGIMRGDQTGALDGGRPITRAEFITMLNRAFGYLKTGTHPFRDVTKQDWYADDIGIAYQIGYFQGKSTNTAAPRENLTREQAITILCRNLMLQPQAGENLDFTDSRMASDWSRGYLSAAKQNGIISGYPDGTIRPRALITRGEVASMLVNLIGTPINQPGTYSESTAGNLTVSSTNTILQNMTVTGQAFITPGVGLGNVTLSNVETYGNIIASGSGESNEGDVSIILKNTTAPALIVDSPSNQYMTLRANGNTQIQTMHVRTDAYFEGKTMNNGEVKEIVMDGEEGTKLDLSGTNSKVTLLSPKSILNLTRGTVKELTVDEAATQSVVNIEQGSRIDLVNLDTATTINGKGDIGTLYVNAPGCVVETIPDIIYIRPGITAKIGGVDMTSDMANQASELPRILSGYPRLDDLAPNQATAGVKTNKTGTVYWAVRKSGDGIPAASDLIRPPSYGAMIVKSGKVTIKTAQTDTAVKISGLTLDTSYVLSAVLVDSQGKQSAVKSVYFTTPDNSKPNFASGSPTVATTEASYLDFDVVATKTCKLYWAIYKKGADAPTINDLKSGTLPGSIGAGQEAVVRNEEISIRMGKKDPLEIGALTETSEYDVYFFLSDSINDSAIKKMTVKTADRTPPRFVTNYPRIGTIEAKALKGEAMINEDGTVYWAAVKHGATYPIVKTDLTSAEARLLDQQLQIKSGLYAEKSGNFTAKKDTAVTMNLNGLEEMTAYDIYFIAMDTAGNYSSIKVLENQKTLDKVPPTLVSQTFTAENDATPPRPLADTDVILTFSEDIYSTITRRSLYEMYLELGGDIEHEFEVANSPTGETKTWRDIILETFTLLNLDLPKLEQPQAITVQNTDTMSVTVTLNEEGQTEVRFKQAAINLQSGVQYQFVMNNVTDSSNNVMKSPSNVSAPFTTLDAQIDFTPRSESLREDGAPVEFDYCFRMNPYGDSARNASASSVYDLLIASDTTIEFDLYMRKLGGAQPTAWTKLQNEQGTAKWSIIKTPSTKWAGISYNQTLGYKVKDFPLVRSISDTEFGIKITSINESTEVDKWNATIGMKVFCMAGDATNILTSTTGGYMDNLKWTTGLESGKYSSIGNPSEFSFEIVRTNLSAPQFSPGFPRVEAGDSIATISYRLDRAGTLYWVLAEEALLKPYNAQGEALSSLELRQNQDKYQADQLKDISYAQDAQKPSIINLSYIPTDEISYSKALPTDERNMGIVAPTATDIINPVKYAMTGFQSGNQVYAGSAVMTLPTITDLRADQTYYLYFVLKSDSYQYPSPVMCYQFTTGSVVSPQLKANTNGASQVSYTVSPAPGQKSLNAEVSWALFPVARGSYPARFDTKIKDKETGKELGSAINLMKDDTFDKRASDADKEEFWTIINGAAGEGYPTLNQSQAGERLEVKETGTTVSAILKESLLSIDTPYVLFIAARNELGGQPAFRAVTGILRTNINGPRITAISTALAGDASKPESGKDKTRGYLSGTVTLTFDQALYKINPLGDPNDENAYVPQPYLPNDNDIDLGAFDDENAPATANHVNKTSATNTIKIDFRNLQEGNTIRINIGDYSFCNKNGVVRQEPISLVLRPRINTQTGLYDDYYPDGTQKCEFIINGGDYNGLTSEIKGTAEEIANKNNS